MKLLCCLLIALSAFCDDFIRDDTNGIITDNRSGLQWQDDANASLSPTAWQGAIERCEGLALGGYDDWRLPNINELLTIVDYSRFNPALASAFQNSALSRYWSSTSYVANPQVGWTILFTEAAEFVDDKNIECYVRCVRGSLSE
jgi:hypothetical protein